MSNQHTQAVRCDHDGLKMAEVQDGFLILRDKHHGQTHVKIVSLAELLGGGAKATSDLSPKVALDMPEHTC